MLTHVYACACTRAHALRYESCMHTCTHTHAHTHAPCPPPPPTPTHTHSVVGWRLRGGGGLRVPCCWQRGERERERECVCVCVCVCKREMAENDRQTTRNLRANTER